MTFFVLSVPVGPEYFVEHCYEEQVEVKSHIAITQNEHTAGQLQNAFLYKLIGTFENEKQVADFLDAKNKGEEYQLPVKKERKPKEPLKVEPNLATDVRVPFKTNTPWFGQGQVNVT